MPPAIGESIGSAPGSRSHDSSRSTWIAPWTCAWPATPRGSIAEPERGRRRPSPDFRRCMSPPKTRRSSSGGTRRHRRWAPGGRAPVAVGEERLNVTEIAVEAAKTWLRQHLRHVDPDRHVRYQVELKPGSEGPAGAFFG